MPRRNKKKKLEVLSVVEKSKKENKSPHCNGSSCNRFKIFGESCPEENCFYRKTEQQQEDIVIEVVERNSKPVLTLKERVILVEKPELKAKFR